MEKRFHVIELKKSNIKMPVPPKQFTDVMQTLLKYP